MGGLRKGAGRERGQTLIFIVLAMPVFLALIALVIDGSMLLVQRRSLQNAADASALAAAQELPTDSSCTGSCLASVQSKANEYSHDRNGGPSLHACADSSDTNCFKTPYNGHDDQVEVRLQKSTSTLFTRAIGLKNLFDVSARSVATSAPVYGTTTIPGITINASTTVQTTPGGTHTTTDPDIVSGGSGIGFAMSRVCNAIVYTGAGAKSGDPVLGAFATNGGFRFQGNAPKKVTWLGYNQTGCPNDPSSPPSGTSACTSPAWGDASESTNTCVKTLVNLNMNNTLPINWPLRPPTVPTPRSGTWNASTDYASNCINLGSSGTITFSVTSQPAGIYCVTGASTTLQLNGVEPTAGDGHTFFALGGAKIGVSSNSSKLKFYWPSACGSRPTTRSTSFTCFGRNISGYDSQTLLYATNTSTDGSCAICLSGQNNSLTGDIFAPKPDAFPPTPGPTQTGGFVSINGGALTAGSGFIESWTLSMAGNTGSYTGTGTSIVIPGGTHVTTDPATTSTTVYPGTTYPDSVLVSTIGTTIGLGE
jgi:Tfp pilus assembly protein PilX